MNHPESKETNPKRPTALAGATCYVVGVEYSKSYAEMFPRNCAVIERSGDGRSFGACTHYLEDGTTCPRHGKVKSHNAKTMNKLEKFIADNDLDEVDTMNTLIDAGLISDNAVIPSDVADADCPDAIKYLEDYDLT